jgi:predicted TIM-barrel fold metal-dependent hydrolase
VLRRNFWFCSIDDPSAFGALDAIGAERILIESDYPHADSTWPDTQHVVARNVAKLSAEDAARITHRNAAELFRHPLPDDKWLTCSTS